MANSIQAKRGWSAGIRTNYTCSAAVIAGRLVAFTGTDLVAHAGAGSLKVCGVAQHDVPTTAATIQGPKVGDGHELTVLSGDCEVPLTAAGAINAGDRVIAAANGTVAAAGATPDARTVIGYALADIADTAVGLVRLLV